MAAVPIVEPKSSPGGKGSDKAERKLTVLESHGYAMGKTIGSGSYATVKVIPGFHYISKNVCRY